MLIRLEQITKGDSESFQLLGIPSAKSLLLLLSGQRLISWGAVWKRHPVAQACNSHKKRWSGFSHCFGSFICKNRRWRSQQSGIDTGGTIQTGDTSRGSRTRFANPRDPNRKRHALKIIALRVARQDGLGFALFLLFHDYSRDIVSILFNQAFGNATI